jgi:Histidine kinase
MESAQSRSQPVALTAATIIEAWRNLSHRDWATTFLFGISVCLMHLLTWRTKFDVSPPVQLLVLDAIGAIAMMFAVVVADRVTGMNSDRRAAYVTAVVIGAGAAAILDSLALGLVWNQYELAFADPSPDWRTYRVGHSFYLFFEWIALGGVATFVYIDRRRAQAEVAHLHEAEMERARTARGVFESRLQAMQARVEPQFLFNTLAQVKRLYEMDPGLAQRMLDELIAYLRAAMPRMRDTSSTVGQEIELARAYLHIVKLRLGDRLAFDIDVPKGADRARMPPMMLLPLIDHAVVHGLGPAQTNGTIRIVCTIAHGRLRLTVADSGAGFVPGNGGDGIASIRERLAVLYGDDARLELHQLEQKATEAVMEIPYEAVRDHDRPMVDRGGSG